MFRYVIVAPSPLPPFPASEEGGKSFFDGSVRHNVALGVGVK
jgi:hypothetical protein